MLQSSYGARIQARKQDHVAGLWWRHGRLDLPTPSDSLCQALDLSQVQHARFQNGVPFCGTINSLSTSLAYHDIKDVMVSAWAPAVGHIVDVRWVPRITRKTRRWRCVESVTVSVVSVSAQLVMEDMSVCRACDPLDHLSHLSMACDFLGVVEKIVFWCTNSKESASRVMFRPRHSCTLVLSPLTAT